jgi:hypothetical protein
MSEMIDNIFEKIRVKQLSVFGWKLIVVFAAINLILTALVWVLPWWIMDYHSNCNDGHSVHYIVDLNVGVCEVSSQAEFHHSNCIHWDDKESWEEIDQIANSHTTEYATHTFPHVIRLRAAYSGTIFCALFVSLFALFKPNYSFLCQYVTILISSLYILLVFAMQIASGANDVVSKDVWKAVTGCDQGSSIPYLAEYGVAIAQVFGVLIILVATFPNRIICFHLVNAKDGIKSLSFSLSPNQYDQESLSASLTTLPTGRVTGKDTDSMWRDSEWKINYSNEIPPPAPLFPRLPSLVED